MTMHPDELLLNNYVDDELEPAERLVLEQHLGECQECRDIVEQLRRVTCAAEALRHTPREPPTHVWPSIQHAIDPRPVSRHFVFGGWRAGPAAAAAVLLVAGAAFTAGLLVGRQTAHGGQSDAQLAALQQEVHDMRQMVTLSLLQQQSASERLNGIMWTDRIEKPGAEVISALLDTLMHDPNVNVRLATIDALKRFSADPKVRRGAVEALASQSSPLVQISLIDFLVDARASESADTLRRLSEDPQVDQAVRGRAALGLQRIG